MPTGAVLIFQSFDFQYICEKTRRVSYNARVMHETTKQKQMIASILTTEKKLRSWEAFLFVQFFVLEVWECGSVGMWECCVVGVWEKKRRVVAR